MGDSTEEMLNVTIKRIEAIMTHYTPEKALKAEVHNLIDAAIVILKNSNIELNKAAEYWEQLKGYAKTLYIESVTLRNAELQAGQFHLSNILMAMICLCKMKKEHIELLIKEADEDKPRQSRKVLRFKNGRPYFAENSRRPK